jgi:DNA-binding transcriptional regulator GbsR (MarR family)
MPKKAAPADDTSREQMFARLTSVLEAVGFPHTISRVYGALLLAEGEGLSTGELIGQLGVSKASVSNAMQFLVGTDLAERYRVAGSREAHYRTLKGRWGGILARKFAATDVVVEVTQEAMALTSSPKARERLGEIHDIYAFFADELENIMQRFNERTGR